MKRTFIIDSNRYLAMSEMKSKFDDITVEFHDNASSLNYLLVHDSANEVLTVLQSFLMRVLEGNLYLPQHVDCSKGIGYYWNEWANNLPEQGDYEPDYAEDFWLWSTKEIATWLYSTSEETYLEISPVYRWHFEDPEQGVDVSYNDFINNYKTIARLVISHDRLLEWKLQCEDLIAMMCRRHAPDARERDPYGLA